MADQKRVSGRQGTVPASGRTMTATSGRAPAQAPSTSGRVAPPSTSGRAAPQPAPSARMIIPPTSTSGRAPIPAPTASGRAPAVAAPTSTSGRNLTPAAAPARPASSKAIPAPAGRAIPRPGSGATGRRPATSPSGRRGAALNRDPRNPDKPIKKKVRGGPELLYAAGIIAVLGIIALVLGVMKNGKQKEVETLIHERQQALDDNMKLGKDAYRIAETAGMLYVMGKEEGIPAEKKDALPAKLDEKLFGSLRSDSKIYNVIYERNFKDKKNKEQTDQRALNPNRLTLNSIPEYGEVDHDVKVMYGFAENKTVNVVIASKSIPPEANDAANLGGIITVIVRANPDERFERALHPKAKEGDAAPSAAAPAAPAK